jgi:recombination protein RecR
VKSVDASAPGASPAVAPKPAAYPKALDRLIAEFAKLPGIGRRSAERLAFFLLRSDEATAMGLARAVEDIKRTVRHCEVCWSLCDGPRCGICADASRQREIVLVVEQPKDLLALEQTGMYKGLYHVLMGRLSPLEGIGADTLTIASLLERVADARLNPGGVAVREVVLGLNPTLEGDGTALFLGEALRGKGVSVTRLARGLPSGSQLEYANKAVLADAIMGRRRVESAE